MTLTINEINHTGAPGTGEQQFSNLFDTIVRTQREGKIRSRDFAAQLLVDAVAQTSMARCVSLKDTLRGVFFLRQKINHSENLLILTQGLDGVEPDTSTSHRVPLKSMYGVNR